MQTLKWTPPTYFPKASESITEIIDLIKKLIANALAYQRNDSVYLDLSKFPNYGKLSKLTSAEMIKVSKDFEEDLDCIDKKNPLDITLWRARDINQPPHIPYFDSPYGQGRPGWHVECSAMSISTLGEQIDIHGGGIDLIFPHHEAEIAQSEGATGKVPFAKYWIHTGEVSFKKEKMSKSKENLVMVSDLLKKYSPNAIRWLLLSHHWSKPWEYKEKDLIRAQRNVDTVDHVILGRSKSRPTPESMDTEEVQQFTNIMDQNLNTPKALQFLLKLAKQNSKELKKFYQILGFQV